MENQTVRELQDKKARTIVVDNVDLDVVAPVNVSRWNDGARTPQVQMPEIIHQGSQNSTMDGEQLRNSFLMASQKSR